MYNDDLISVIMSTYNEKLEWVKSSVDSILNQTHRNLEFIIVLDNPKNIELMKLLNDYAKKDTRIILIINNENKGLVKSLNIALEYCKGKYIARMDADDISINDRLFIQKKYLEENDLDFVFSGIKVINEESDLMYETNNFALDYVKTRRLLEITNISNHPTWFLKSEIYRKINGYRDISYVEDYDFLLRCLQLGYKIGKMDKNVLLYRIRSNSISRSYSLEQFINSRGILKLYKKNKLEDISSVAKILKSSKRYSNFIRMDNKFIRADCKFNMGVKLIKDKKYIKGITEILKSALISNHYNSKLITIIKYKIINKYLVKR